jgi:hypothetical protein
VLHLVVIITHAIRLQVTRSLPNTLLRTGTGIEIRVGALNSVCTLTQAKLMTAHSIVESVKFDFVMEQTAAIRGNDGDGIECVQKNRSAA